MQALFKYRETGGINWMDNLGVAMNDTTLQAYAMSKGIEKSTQDMTNQEKIGLAMEMFMEKTAYAAGNYAKENETLAGSLGTAKAALSNFLSGAGSVEDVVSAFTNAAQVIINNFSAMFPSLMSGIISLVEQLVPQIPPLLQQVLPALIEGATGLINGLVVALPAILSALLSALPAVIQGVQQIFDAVIQALPTIMQTLVAALPSLIPQLIAGLVSLIVMCCEMLPQIIQPIIDNLPMIISSICDAIIENLPVLISGLIDLIIGLVDAIPQIVQALVDCIPDIIEMLIVALMGCTNALITGAIRLVFSLVAALPQIMASLNEALPKAFLGVWNGVKTIFQKAPQWFSERFNAVVEGVTKVFSGIKDAISKPFEKARDTVKGIADKIKGFFSGQITLPKIPLPHFSISPKGWKIADLLKGSFPSLGIDWYAKAMDDPLVMNRPTIFGYNPATGKLQGGGEAGSEVVSGTNTLMRMIQTAVATQNETLIYYLQRLIEILAEFFPQVLEGMDRPIAWNPYAVADALAVPMNQALGRVSTNKERGR